MRAFYGTCEVYEPVFRLYPQSRPVVLLVPSRNRRVPAMLFVATAALVRELWYSCPIARAFLRCTPLARRVGQRRRQSTPSAHPV